MTVSSTTNKVSASGNGTQDTFAYTFKIFEDGDLDVYIRDDEGTETLKTITTHYTVTGAGNEAGGNVVFTAGNIPASTEDVIIQRKLGLTQGTDYVENDPFPAESHEEALDRLTMITQQMQEEIDRSIKASVTNTITSTEFTIDATDRANKVFAFDGDGDLSVTQELGTFRGDWAASRAYNARDLVKDTSTNNIFLANTAHTSSGSQPLTTNTDSAKWDLIVDAASATTSQTAAAASATTASTKATEAAASATTASGHATTAETHKNDAETAKTAAETAQTAAETAQAAAELAADNFDDTYLGAKASDPTVDNDGDALTTGDLYFNTTSNTLKVYTGSAWADAALTPGDFLASANNLSDLPNAATARTNLGLVIGTDVQAHDAGLAYLDGLNFTDEATFKTAVNLEIGTDVQAHDADTVKKDENNTFTAAQRGSTLTDTTNTGNVTLDFGTYQNFVLTLTGNVTLVNPTTEAVGQSGFIVLIQDSTGGRTLSLGTDYETAGGAGLTLSTAASTTDVVPYIVAASGRILLGTPQLAFS